MTAQGYIDKVNGFIVPYLQKNGFSLIRTEFVSEDHNWYLRLFIDLTEEEFKKRSEELEKALAEENENSRTDTDTESEIPEENDLTDEEQVPGVSINDCVKVSRYLSKWLDKEDFIKEAYTMEVCSKGFLEPEQTVETKEGDLS